MILRKDKSFLKLGIYPNTDWVGDADWVLDDNTQQELEDKIIELYPNFDFVLNDDGELIDVVATEKPPEPEPSPTLEDRIAELEAYNATLTECILEMSEYVYS